MKLKAMDKIRRCREHVLVLKDGENCSFLKHDKNNKIEEMTKQEVEILAILLNRLESKEFWIEKVHWASGDFQNH